MLTARSSIIDIATGHVVDAGLELIGAITIIAVAHSIGGDFYGHPFMTSEAANWLGHFLTG